MSLKLQAEAPVTPKAFWGTSEAGRLEKCACSSKRHLAQHSLSRRASGRKTGFDLARLGFRPRAEPQFRYGEPEIRAHLLP
jgi:hypothetical protein